MSTKSIVEAIDSLPERNVTTYVLNALDFIVPGEWTNYTDFRQMVADVAGETGRRRVRDIEDMVEREFDATESYQRALWLYRSVDTSDRLLAAAALANKLGERFGFLDFLTRITPKTDKAQGIDLGLKVAAEVLGFTLLNREMREAVDDFGEVVRTYNKDGLLRMASLVSLDGLVPLGPDFIDKAAGVLNRGNEELLGDNPIYRRLADLMPGESPADHLSFLSRSFNGTRQWMDELVSRNNLTPELIVSKLESVLDIADDKLDYVGVFLDATTNYFAHTGTQSVARHLILDAVTLERGMGRGVSGKRAKPGKVAMDGGDERFKRRSRIGSRSRSGRQKRMRDELREAMGGGRSGVAGAADVDEGDLSDLRRNHKRQEKAMKRRYKRERKRLRGQQRQEKKTALRWLAQQRAEER